MTTAINIGRINVWPTYDAAREADTAECEFVGRLTVWRTNAEARAHLTSGGEGGAPAWVPANAVIHIDLVRAFNELDAAWTAADGVVAVDTLLGADENLDETLGETFAYSTEYLVAFGYNMPGVTAYLGALRTMVLAGATGVVRSSTIGEGATNHVSCILASADGGDAIEFDLSEETLAADVYSYNGSLAGSINAIVNFAEAEGIINVAAFTVTASRMDIAVNGSAAVAGVVDATDRPPGNPFVAAGLNVAGALQSITLYDALPSTTGLSELSEVV